MKPEHTKPFNLEHARDKQRPELEAYWKALDEFNGVKA